ncbi:MAG: MerR family transcriptional regulator [Proteobacteria bacterium]|nr:MerR family transcriptional regulator [Pseudomonadota bacterium]
MKVSELAEKLKTTADTVRYYTQQGFLMPVKNSENGYKNYGIKDQHRLRFVLSARGLGFSVKDISHILNHSEKGETACPLVRSLIEERLAYTDEQFKKTKVLRNRMKKAISQWQSRPDKDPTGDMVCHLIEEFEESLQTEGD